MRVFIAALFTMAQTRETTEVPFPQWMERPWSSHTICCCSAIREIRLSSRQKTWRGHKCIVLSERSQCGKPYMFYDSNRIFWKKQSSKNDQRLSGVWGGRPGIDRRRLFLRQTPSSVVQCCNACHYKLVKTLRMSSTETEGALM